MYLGAQRVANEDGSTSVSLHYYTHRGILLDSDAPRLRDVRWVAQFVPGQLLAQRRDRPGTGRPVRSFLDVSGPDTVSIHEVRALLDQLRAALEAGHRLPLEHGRCGAEFYAGKLIPADSAIAEFDALCGELTAFAVGAFETAPPARQFTARARREADRTVIAWDDASRAALIKLRPDWTPTTVSIADDVRRDFESVHGSFYPHAMDALSPLPQDDLRQAGGAQIVDHVTGDTLWFTSE